MTHKTHTTLLAILAILLPVSLSFALEVGDDAPSLDAVNWVQGEAPDFSKQITVVEFWATWCPPCRDSIPHLNALSEQYGDKVAIVGISNEKEATVKKFIDKMGDDMSYPVGLWEDTDPYMSEIGGIPHAFIVDKSGKVVWHGHPMAMDSVLEQAVEGTLDPEKLAKVGKLEAALQASFESGDIDTIKDATMALLEADSANQGGISILFGLAQELDDPKLVDDHFNSIEVATLSGKEANALGWMIMTQEDYTMRDLKLAHEFLSHAIEKLPESADVIDSVARLHYLAGDLDGAIKLAEKATSLADEEAKEYFQNIADYYRQAKTLNSEL